ncbi:hypothetical protein ACNPON_13910 [Glutamicibacter sp. AGC13]
MATQIALCQDAYFFDCIHGFGLRMQALAAIVQNTKLPGKKRCPLS